jgi:hypothetical protein
LGKTDDKSIENKTEINICLIILQAHSRAHKQTPRKTIDLHLDKTNRVYGPLSQQN